MKYGTCKECDAQIPLMKAFKVKGYDVYECPTCGHPHGLHEMVITEYKFNFREMGVRKFEIGATDTDGSWVSIAVAYSLAHARTIVEALNEKRDD